MKALCIRQPWAAMIAIGAKKIETRKWPTSYRGEFLVVASSQPQIKGLLSGYAIATVKIIDCRPMTKEDEEASGVELYPGAWAWVLSHPVMIIPFPVSGRLKFFEVEKDVTGRDGIFVSAVFGSWYAGALQAHFGEKR